ncbi:polysaccharide lyase 6 family protein [Temperatibacter marinus]|uniref:Polysaccharide lyase 6 family protein n=2 Tax=Temperatibacter marinus TaxID=1456591 RepID=A0AA52HBV9_9PROT|nr:polysaccharide lyase 6 family protein [Temperatibacter marinus]WND04160.1 polysaccharide lyase 6 family protein [Temperatibacter marinus]
MITVLSPSAYSKDYLVTSKKEYNKVSKSVKAGDVIRLRDGIWKDFDIRLEAKGTKDKPIVLTAETKGGVILVGQSSLRFAGEYLHISGLVFKDGYTPRSSVIEYRINKDRLANNSRVSEVVIDSYNNPERYETDFWVMMYGKNNRFDHNHLIGKRNKGVTMAVRLNSAASQENHHRIDHNYFGPRPILGSNGGETLRIGTSHYSLSNSFTVVENNYFDRTNGELEIISVKAGKNIIRNNTFFEARGTLTLRHGNGNLLEGNIFLGNGKDHTGGLRVINADHIVRNNYMEGLKGYRFGGALVVMNGVPNSPINRYHQVKNTIIENNTLVNSDHIQLAAGSDKERSAVPVGSKFQDNLIYNEDKRNSFTVYDDISGIDFESNLIKKGTPNEIGEGFKSVNLTLKRASNGLLYPKETSKGVSSSLKVTHKDATGVTWYSKPSETSPFDTGKTYDVHPGEDTLYDAVQSAKAGDILYLNPGTYTATKLIALSKPLTIRSKVPVENPEESKVKILFERTALFEIADGGSLKLYGLLISGEDAPDSVGNAVIRTSKYSMLQNYHLIIKNSHFVNLDKNRSFDLLKVAPGTMADQISIENTYVDTVSGTILKLDQERDDYGRYNAEYVDISGSRFTNIQGPLISFYRGGTDESTFGPHFSLRTSLLGKVGRGKKNGLNASIFLHGVQVSRIANTVFKDSQVIRVEHTVGEPVTQIVGNKFQRTSGPTVSELYSLKKNTAVIKDNEESQ